jgi:tripartite-type tricarboxylate transporter receptor subunit TctC
MTALRCLLALLLSASLPSWAQDYPSKPVRLIVPYGAGGGADASARSIAQKFSEIWGQTVVVENRPGAGGTVGTAAVAKSPPDGYTLLYHSNAMAITPGLYRKLSFDPIKDIVPVTMVSSSTMLLVTAAGSSISSVADMVKQAKASPGKLNFASTGPGGPIHLVMEMLKLEAGIELVHVAYKGDGQIVPAVLSGEVHVTFTPINAGIRHVRSGKYRALAVSGPTRSRALPDVPTLKESGWPDVVMETWQALFAPGGTPRAIVAKIAADGLNVIKDPGVLKGMTNSGQEPVGMPPEAFEKQYRAEVARYTKVIKEAGVPLVD